MSSGPGRLVRNLVSLATGEVTSRLIGFLAFAVLARRLTPAEYGAVEFAVGLALFFSMASDFGLETIGARSIARNRDELARFAAQIPPARLVMVLIAIPVMVGVAAGIGQPESTVRLVLLYGTALLALPFFQRWLFQGLELMDFVSVGQVIRSAAFCGGVALFVRSHGDLLTVGAVEIASAVAAMIFYLIVQKRRIALPPLDFSLTGLRDLYRQSASVGLSQMVWAANQYLPTLLVAALASPVELSWLGASQRIVFSVIAFSWVYHFNLFPSLARSLTGSRPAFDALIGASFRSMSWLGVGMSLAGSLFAEPLCQIVFGDKFAAAAVPLAILVWAIPITLLSGHARITLIAAERQALVLASQLTGVATTLVIGVATIPRYGAVAGSVTILISYLAVWIAAHWFAARHVGRLPLFSVLRPVLLAALLYALREYLVPSSIVAGIGALTAYAVIGPLLDRKFVADIGRILATRSAAPGTPA